MKGSAGTGQENVRRKQEIVGNVYHVVATCTEMATNEKDVAARIIRICSNLLV